jgi:hypothetical protein
MLSFLFPFLLSFLLPFLLPFLLLFLLLFFLPFLLPFWSNVNSQKDITIIWGVFSMIPCSSSEMFGSFLALRLKMYPNFQRHIMESSLTPPRSSFIRGVWTFVGLISKCQENNKKKENKKKENGRFLLFF